MKISSIAVKRPVTTIMMMLLVLLLGFVSLTGLKLDLLPNINPPIVAIMTTYPGAGPEEVAEMVTKPVEASIGTTNGLSSMQSRSSANSSLIIAQFAWGTDITEARDDINSKLGLLQLPSGVGKPMLLRFDPNSMPIIQIAISNGDDLKELQRIVEQEIVPELQSIDGVASVNVTGGFGEEIAVLIDEDQLREYNLTQQMLVQMIQGNNFALPGGVVEEEHEKLNLRILSKIDSVDQLKLLPVSVVPTMEGMQIITLEDVADVRVVDKDVSSISRTDARDSLLISIQKEGTANTVEVSNLVKNQLEIIESSYEHLTIITSDDQGEIIQQSISNVSKSLMFGALFAVLVIFVFLRSPGSTLIVAIAIPFSIISTFVLMYFNNMTLNIMSMGGLALGVGMLVDNAIVVIENINRHLTMKKTRIQAAIDGVSEVGSAITASMLTTVAVFLPIVFVGGLVGDLFKELSFTVAFSLLSSWLVAITVVPTLAGLLLNPQKVKPKNENRIYKASITWALNHRLIAVVLTLIVLGASIAMIPRIGTEFMPTQDEGQFSIQVRLPAGTKLESTLDVVKDMEQIIMDESLIKTVTASIGGSNNGMFGGSENRASLTVRVVDRDDRELSTEEIMEQMKGKLSHFESNQVELSYSLSSSMQGISGSPNEINVRLLGQNKNQLLEYVAELEKRLLTIEGVTSVTNSTDRAIPEYQFVVDREKAIQNGLGSYQVATFINDSLQGKVATKISDNGVETEVRVRVDGIQNSIEAIESLSIVTPMGRSVELRELGEITLGQGPITIVREDQKDALTVTATFKDTDLGSVSSAVQREISKMKEDLNINTNLYSINTSGGAEMMDDSFQKLLLALVLAIIFVYMIMASQFESLMQPFIIMLTLPLTIIGITLGLLVTGYSFGITAFIGIIILVGIVVNNAIVFIDYTNQLKAQGLAVKEALIQAGTTRLRPIVMTALTTMLGLLPLAIGTGEGTEMQAPMAIAVIGGLLSATVLTLIVIPVIYSVVESMKSWLAKKLFKSRPVEASGN